MKGHIHMEPEETAKLKTLRWHASTRGTNKAEDDILCNMTEPINGCGALKNGRVHMVASKCIPIGA